MSIEVVRKYLSDFGKGEQVMEFPVSSATVELAAQALGTAPARIAKTLSFQGPGAVLQCQVFLVPFLPLCQLQRQHQF